MSTRKSMSKNVSSQNSMLPAGASTSKQIRTGTMMTLYRMRNSITMSHFILIGAVGVSMHLPFVGSSSTSSGSTVEMASFFAARSVNLFMVKRLERVLTDVGAGTSFTGVATVNGGFDGELRPSGDLSPGALLSVFLVAEVGFLAPVAFGLYGFLLATLELPPPATPLFPCPAFMHCWRIMPACSVTW